MGKQYNRTEMLSVYRRGIHDGVTRGWSKPWYKSRTIWTSVVIAVLSVVEAKMNVVFPEQSSLAVVLLGTAVSSIVAALRVITSGAVEIRRR